MINLFGLLKSIVGKREAKVSEQPQSKQSEEVKPTTQVDMQEDLTSSPARLQNKPLQEVEILVKDEDTRLKKELEELKEKNPGLYQLALALAQYVNVTYNKQVVITMIFRTDAEQDYLYRDSEAYKQKKFKSPHQFWQALDLRSWIYSFKERKEMVDWINSHYDQRNQYGWTAKVHEVGSNGLHFHIQFLKKA